jgi:uncharacterized protein (UPF0335 family)
MAETPKERFLRQLEALKRKDFKEVVRIGKEARAELDEKDIILNLDVAR